jgi:hypothetical protein
MTRAVAFGRRREGMRASHRLAHARMIAALERRDFLYCK